MQIVLFKPTGFIDEVALAAASHLADTFSFSARSKVYYTAIQILLLLAFMALCRIKSTEKLKRYSPGEFGNLLGLDRAPEVRCLRRKMDALSVDQGAKKWATHLSQYWMEQDPDWVGSLYIDGHVRVYHGKLTELPRRYVSRQRLCLRGITDYWVNDAIGRPFFVIEKQIDPGMLSTLREDIVPRLLKDVPNQPSEEQLKNDPNLCRFVLVFDREGYSPAFFKAMWEKHRIGCMTYHKFPDAPWPEEWFAEHEVAMPNGEVVKMLLCEMGSLVGSGKDAMWMKQVRKLTDSGHQTSIVSTAFDFPQTQLAARMFSRWCQENFFNYMIVCDNTNHEEEVPKQKGMKNMKRKIVLLAVTVLFSITGLAHANLIENGTFDNDLDGWTVAGDNGTTWVEGTTHV
ncbi:hypothetical protein DSCO28_71280 [Desulfosarcina ovata subsp. sediminis]|uniref:Uncharacterized protein n=1 Tax=Desulfosarcina ovata subsp. sediminis TaxID=885957 RepID=A0A5K8A1Z1_9BACT|nr:hypothetical protein DSCO28_71280 [Desulfosarcina ovata subsp. sediminis]